jgi:hypothetical protein
MKTILITFDELGNIEIEALGFKGKACEAATEKMIKALGVPVCTKKKPEYYTEDKTQIHN